MFRFVQLLTILQYIAESVRGALGSLSGSLIDLNLIPISTLYCERQQVSFQHEIHTPAENCLQIADHGKPRQPDMCPRHQCDQYVYVTVRTLFAARIASKHPGLLHWLGLEILPQLIYHRFVHDWFVQIILLYIKYQCIASKRTLLRACTICCKIT